MKKTTLLSLSLFSALAVQAEQIVIEVPEKDIDKYHIKVVPSKDATEPNVKYSGKLIKPDNSIDYTIKQVRPLDDMNKFMIDMEPQMRRFNQKMNNFHNYLNDQFKGLEKERKEILNKFNDFQNEERAYKKSFSFITIGNPKIAKDIKFEGNSNHIQVIGNITIGNGVVFNNVGKCKITRPIPDNTIITKKNANDYCKKIENFNFKNSI